MLESSFIYFIARTLPESIILMLSGYLLLGIKIKDKLPKIIKLGILLGIFILVVRKLPITFGIHTILSMIIQGVIMYIFLNKDIVLLMAATFQVWISLILSEAIYIPIATKVLHIKLDVLTNNQEIESALSTLPSLMIVVILVLLFREFNKRTILKGREKCQ